MGADAAGEGQGVSQLVEHLRLTAAPASRRVPRTFLPQLWGRPETIGLGWGVGNGSKGGGVAGRDWEDWDGQ